MIAFLTALKSIFCSIPALRDIVKMAIKLCKDYDTQRKKENARDRWKEKNAAVDAAIDDILRLHNPPAEAEQQRKTDEPPRV